MWILVTKHGASIKQNHWFFNDQITGIKQGKIGWTFTKKEQL
jgi:hypothetical protein